MSSPHRPDGLRDTYDRIADDWARDHQEDTWWREGTTYFASLLATSARVLDAGCGSGQKARFFQDLGMQVIGIDFSAKLLEIARRTSPDSEFRLLDLRDIGSMSESFDGVFAQASLLHIPKSETFAVLEGMASRLAPDGLLYVAVKSQREGSPEEEILTESDYGYDYQRFFSYHSLEELRSHLDRLGLSLVHTDIPQATSRGDWIQLIARPRGAEPHCQSGSDGWSTVTHGDDPQV